MKSTLTAVFQKVRGGYVAFVEELPGANTQGKTLAEARANLEEAIHMVLKANREMAEGIRRRDGGRGMAGQVETRGQG